MVKFYPLAVKLLSIFLLCFFTNQTFANQKLKPHKLRQYIPAGFELLDSASGDLNADGYSDFVLVLRSSKENINPGQARPLLVLMGTAKGGLELTARNDKVVLCSDCGGMFGDPYQNISIKDQSLSVEHSVGGNGNWKWSRIITFKYDIELSTLVLHDDINFSHTQFNANRPPEAVGTKTDLDKLPFIEYSYNKGY